MEEEEESKFSLHYFHFSPRHSLHPAWVQFAKKTCICSVNPNGWKIKGDNDKKWHIKVDLSRFPAFNFLSCVKCMPNHDKLRK